MIISDFTKPELDLFREQCNFVGHEKDLFEMRSQGISLVAIARKIGYTTDGINDISRKVNNKIKKVLELQQF